MKNGLLLLFVTLLLTFNKSLAQSVPSTLWSANAVTTWYDNLSTEFTLSTAEELAGLSVLVAGGNDFEGKTIIVGANIDLAAHLWSPIGPDWNIPFSGTFDGNGFDINNLFIVLVSGDYVGLFGKCYGATLMNVQLKTVYLRARDTAGSLAGSFGTNSSMENCNAEGVDIVATHFNIGGLVGELIDDSHMLRCSSKGSVTGSNQVGGLLGTPYNLTSVSECYSEGTVSANYLAGGLIGFSTFTFTANRENTVRNCYSRANVTVVDGRAGGFCGGTDANLILEYCYSTGTATGAEFEGGFIGAVGSINTSACFWDMETSGHADAIGGWTASPQSYDITGKTTVSMKTPAMVDLLNGSQVSPPWTIDPVINDGYPILSSAQVSVQTISNTVNSVKVYPTVFDEYLNIESTENLVGYSLVDLSGKIIQRGVLNGNDSKLDTDSVDSGTYILLITTDKGTKSQKIIKH